ncbi:hypothetical protein [Helicobacter typhlonius]|uniref:hypothetical protein n=3 Tax=Helicobacter typhlonius TaxID=76936 RepID=UPI00051DB9EC|nr:hypothetical protein [Helicobacter sp.]
MLLRYILQGLLSVCAFGADIIVPLQDEAFSPDSLNLPYTRSVKSTNNAVDKSTLEKHSITQSLSLHYLNSYMRHHQFGISVNGVGLEYHRILVNNNQSDVLLSVQTNFTKSSLQPFRTNTQDFTLEYDANFQIGTLAQLDILFAQSDRGYHMLGFELGFAFALPARLAGGVSGVEFDEQSVLFNVDYGYGFSFGKYTLMPFVRLESYAFFPLQEKLKNRRPVDSGFNMLMGVKNIWDMRYFEGALSVGALSDLNLSSSGVGVLANGVIVYDRLGMSNGVFGEISIGILETKHFHLLVKSNFSYMLSYYELNWQNGLSALLRF